MPIYEYDCPGCGRSFEKITSASQADSAVCPKCGNKHPQRRLSLISVKGSARATVAPAPGGG